MFRLQEKVVKDEEAAKRFADGHENGGIRMVNVKIIDIDENDVFIIRTKNGGANVTLSLVEGSSALPIEVGQAIKISGMLSASPIGYSPGNSSYNFRKYREDYVFVQPGIVIPHESQLPRCYIRSGSNVLEDIIPNHRFK